MFNTDPQVFWPGALIQGDSYETGSPLLVPLVNRAPMNISVQGVYANQASAFDVTPTQSEVNQAVSELLAGAVRNDTPSHAKRVLQSERGVQLRAVCAEARLLGSLPRCARQGLAQLQNQQRAEHRGRERDHSHLHGFRRSASDPERVFSTG